MTQVTKLWPLLTATHRYDKSISTWQRGHGQLIEAPILAYLIETKHGRILYDVGCDYQKIADPLLRERWYGGFSMGAPQMTEDCVEVDGLRVDPVTHRVTGNGSQLDLGPTEFRLLHFFMTHQERVFNRTMLLDQVWGDHVFVEERTVDVHIRRLRAVLEATGHDRLIQTVRGSGYRFSSLPG